MKDMECDEAGELKEYIGCKIDINKDELTLQVTQPVLLQSFVDEFKLPDFNPVTPAVSGETLHADEEVELLDVAGHSNLKYQSGVGKLLQYYWQSCGELRC
jgi:hypothetical protein